MDAVDVTHETTVPAPAPIVFGLVADVARGPWYFPSHLHAEIHEETADGDVVERWAVRDGKVRNWRVRRTIDRADLRISFAHEKPDPPVARMLGEWTFTERPDGRTRAAVRHRVGLTEEAPELAAKLRADLDINVPAQLADIGRVAESFDRLVTVEARYTVRTLMARDEAYRRVVEGETGDARIWARACLPPHKIVYRRLSCEVSTFGEFRFGHGEVTAVRAATIPEGYVPVSELAAGLHRQVAGVLAPFSGGAR